MSERKSLFLSSTLVIAFEHWSGQKMTCKIGACAQAAVHARHPDVKALSTNGSKRVLETAMEQ